MKTALILLLVLMVASFILSLLGFLEIGIIVDDHYVFASKEKRKYMNRKAHQRQSAILFMSLGITYLLYIFRLITGILWFKYAALAVCFAAMVYAIVSHYKIRKKS